MPMKREQYPDNWQQISLRIRTERALNKCEQCGAPNGGLIARYREDPSLYVDMSDEADLYRTAEIETFEPVAVVLTVHHIGVDKPDGTPGSAQDKMDCRDENLIALCQRCHLLADLAHNIKARLKTLANKKHQAALDAGQLPLFGD